MFKLARRPFTYANVTATLALVFAMSGGALAARHYMISSTGQINPKVLKSLRGKKGATGVNGAQGREGPLGKEGKEGAAGKEGKEGREGREGKEGKEGHDGAVAGYGATQTSGLNLAGHSTLVQIPGLSKALPPGSYVVSANVEVDALSPTEAGAAGVQCELVDTPASGSPTSQPGSWLSAVDVQELGFGFFAAGEIPLHMAVGTGANASTIAVLCKVGVKKGKEISITANNASLVAVQTSQNS